MPANDPNDDDFLLTPMSEEDDGLDAHSSPYLPLDDDADFLLSVDRQKVVDDIENITRELRDRVEHAFEKEKIIDDGSGVGEYFHSPGGTETLKARDSIGKDFEKLREGTKKILSREIGVYSESTLSRIRSNLNSYGKEVRKRVEEKEKPSTVPAATPVDPAETPSDASAPTENPADTGSSASTAADAGATPATTAPTPSAGRRFLDRVKNIPKVLYENFQATIDDIKATRKEIQEQQIEASAKALENIKNERTRLSDEQKIIDQLEKNMKEIRDYKEERRQKSPLYRFGKYIWSYTPAVRLKARLEKSEAKAEGVEAKLKKQSDKEKMKKEIAENKKLVADYKKKRREWLVGWATSPFTYTYGKTAGVVVGAKNLAVGTVATAYNTVIRKPVSKLWSALDIINPGSDKFWLYNPDSKKK